MIKRNITRTVQIVGIAFFALFYSCETDDNVVIDDTIQEPEPEEPEEPEEEPEDPIFLDCNYFSNNPNAVLTDNPNAPIDYVIDCVMNITDNVTIEPGVTIAFTKTSSGLFVGGEGSLSAVGTADNPITFTGTEQQKGWWGGIFIGNDNANNKISHAIIEYAGGTNIGSGTGGIYGGVTVSAFANLELTNSTIRHSAEAGLGVAMMGGDAYGQPDMIANNKFENNIYTDNLIPVRIPAYLAGKLGKNDTYSGNEIDKINISGGRIRQVQAEWQKTEVPYWVSSNINIRGSLSESHNTRLTIEAGTTVEMGGGLIFAVWDGYNALTAVGTASEPIVFRGEDPVAGAWGRFQFRQSTSPHNRMEHVNISHAGGGSYDEAMHLNLHNNTLSITLDNIHFSEISPSACSINRISSNTANISNITRDVPSTNNECWYH